MSSIDQLNALRKAGSNQHRSATNRPPEVVLDDPRMGLLTPKPKFDFFRPFESLKRGKAWSNDYSTAQADAILKQRDVREHVTEQAAATAKTKSDHDQLRKDAAIAGESVQAINEETVKLAVLATKDSARVVVVGSRYIKMLQGMPDINEELLNHCVSSTLRVCKRQISDLEMAALGFDPSQIGGIQ